MEPLIDQEALLERVDGDPGFLASMIGIFVADAPVRLEAIRAAVRGADAHALEHAAHSLKGSLATMAAEGAAKDAFALEELGRSGRVEGAAVALARLERRVAQVTAALQDLLGRLTPDDAA